MNRRVTQQDIANRRKLDKSTVSLALRNNPTIAAATRVRVRTMAEKLGYRPDPALSTLARQRWAGHETGSGAALAYLVDSRMPNYGSHGRFLPSDRKSTRLNSSHVKISYAVFCLKKKKHST